MNGRVTRTPSYTDRDMANLAITIDDALLKRARMRALEQGTSVNALLREYLEAYAGSARLQARTAALRALTDLAVFPVIAIDAALVQRAAACAVADQVAYRDAPILEAAVEAGAATVYSDDLQHGRARQGVTVQDPFAA